MQIPTAPQIAQFSSPKRKRGGPLDNQKIIHRVDSGSTHEDYSMDLSGSPDAAYPGAECLYKQNTVMFASSPLKSRENAGLVSPPPTCKINTTAATTEPTPMDSSDLSTITPKSSPPSFVNDSYHDGSDVFIDDDDDDDDAPGEELHRTTRALFSDEDEDGMGDHADEVTSSAARAVSPGSEATSAFIGMRSLSIQRNRSDPSASDPVSRYYSDASEISSASPLKYRRKSSGENNGARINLLASGEGVEKSSVVSVGR
jgi:hypothetical protein